MSIEDLISILPKTWEKRPDNTPTELLKLDEPSAGQCAVTSLVVQDYFGGEILNTIASDVAFPDVNCSHYFNVIDGKEVDLTRAQFKEHVKFSVATPKPKEFRSTREYILSYESTVKRYKKLKYRVEKLLTS